MRVFFSFTIFTNGVVHRVHMHHIERGFFVSNKEKEKLHREKEKIHTKKEGKRKEEGLLN